jgi:hypothetical protein
MDEASPKELPKRIESEPTGEEYSREEIDKKIARGLAQIYRGETIDGEEAFRRLRSRSAARR